MKRHNEFNLNTMKITRTHLLRGIAGVSLGFLALAVTPLRAAQDQAAPVTLTNAPAAVATTNSSAPPEATNPASAPTPAADAGANASASAPTSYADTNGLHINFRNAPLSLVLDFMSEAAGFIINKETDVHGTVEMYSKDAVTKEEAVKLLESALAKNHYTLVRDGRILTVVANEDAKTNPNIPTESGADPEAIDATDETVTQLIPVRYASASQLMNNVQILLPTSDTLTVNESANTILMVAPKRDIKRILKIVKALDTAMASSSTIRVFPLHYADAKQLATELGTLFAPTQTGGQGGGGGRGQFFQMMAQRFGGGGGPGGFPGAGNSGSSGNAAANHVVATSDDYSNSLIVSAPADLMETIGQVIHQIDVATTDVTELRLFKLKHADPTELADQLSQLFPDSTQSSSTGGPGFGFRFGGRFGGFGGGNSQASNADRTKKKAQVIAVADPRTSTLMVSAASELMPHIEAMIKDLDSVDAKREVVKVFDLNNADPQDVYQVMMDIFNKNNTMRATTSSRGSMLGQNNPLTTRETQQQQNNTPGSSFGSSRGGAGGGGF